MIDRFFERYGYDGRSGGGWAYIGQLEDLFELWRLQAEAVRRGLRPPVPPRVEDPTTELQRLRLQVWAKAYMADQARQRTVCLALDLPWPPEQPNARRPWSWPWEQRVDEESPIIAPADWRPDDRLEADRYDLARLAEPGSVLVLPPAQRRPRRIRVEPTPVASELLPFVDADVEPVVRVAAIVHDAGAKARELMSAAPDDEDERPAEKAQQPAARGRRGAAASSVAADDETPPESNVDADTFDIARDAFEAWTGRAHPERTP